MKKIFFTTIAFIAAFVVNAQTIKVYEYDGNRNLNSTPSFTSSNKVKVIFTEDKEPEAEHEYVDLGLPSGTLWATCNIGAESPTEKGLFFAWGDIEGHTEDYEFSWNNYKFFGGTNPYPTFTYQMTKYTYQNNKTNGDYNIDLDHCDDAAYVIWGHDWEMPTNYQVGELVYNCCWDLTNDYNGTGVSGCIAYKVKSDDDRGKRIIDGKVTNKYNLSDPHIFFASGETWSRSLNIEENNSSIVLNIGSNQGAMQASTSRNCGLNIRPVRLK